MYKKKPQKTVAIAKQRITHLFGQAAVQFSNHPELSTRYVQLARKLAMKYKLKLPRSLQRQFCKHCYTYLVPNANCRVRIRNNNIIYTCLTCKKFTKFGYKPRRKQ